MGLSHFYIGEVYRESVHDHAIALLALATSCRPRWPRYVQPLIAVAAIFDLNKPLKKLECFQSAANYIFIIGIKI